MGFGGAVCSEAGLIVSLDWLALLLRQSLHTCWDLWDFGKKTIYESTDIDFLFKPFKFSMKLRFPQSQSSIQRVWSFCFFIRTLLGFDNVPFTFVLFGTCRFLNTLVFLWPSNFSFTSMEVCAFFSSNMTSYNFLLQKCCYYIYGSYQST